MIIPRPLAKGDSIGVTAPSFGVTDPTDIARFANARRRLEDRGYRVVETPDVYSCFDDEGRSAPAEQRVEELQSLMSDGGTSYIVSAKGGDYQFEMLPLMDWDLVERNPKWVQGYSDNTTLLFKITAEHDIATVYGGNFGDYGMEPWHRSVSECLEVIEGTRRSQASFPYHEGGFSDRVTGLEGLNEEVSTVWGGEGSFTGRLIGGCMDVLEWFHAKGTADPSPFVESYSDEGIVWYMETYDMDDRRVVRMLEGMASDGWFDGVTGFVFGRPLFYSGRDYAETIRETLDQFDVPVITDADVGHKAPRMTFVNGAVARFDVSGGKASLNYL